MHKSYVHLLVVFFLFGFKCFGQFNVKAVDSLLIYNNEKPFNISFCVKNYSKKIKKARTSDFYFFFQIEDVRHNVLLPVKKINADYNDETYLFQPNESKYITIPFHSIGNFNLEVGKSYYVIIHLRIKKEKFSFSFPLKII